MNSVKHMTLLELNRLVREVLETDMPDEYWVEAELSECRENRGHCYMELIEKDPHTATPVARASAKCWASNWMLVKSHFERTTRQQLHSGMKVLLRVYPQFHEAYGFSWIVTDIDPTYTLGDMARKRQEIIRQLKAEGIFDLQRELPLPLFCQHIAVISSESAAGYGDFCHQLNDNPYGLKFQTQLFPAIMQGEGIEQSIINALNSIYDDAFDCVVIIRGGGATSDLSGFDTLQLAENVANFPLPVITGIGHDRDESILDMVSHLQVKTPTAAAAFLVGHVKEVLDAIDEAQTAIAHAARQRLTTLSSQLTTVSNTLPHLFSVVKTRHEALLDNLYRRMLTTLQTRVVGGQAQLEAAARQLPLLIHGHLEQEQHRLEMLAEKARSQDPQLLLRRGYSITLHKGHAVKETSSLRQGDILETRLADGTIHSVVSDNPK
ncbi:MAG: exodeoxyribonuclease VII large subunit [Prevotella sp.]|nr:exodeoxyribonuclease VII large subunit [Prevotella sp.]